MSTFKSPHSSPSNKTPLSPSNPPMLSDISKSTSYDYMQTSIIKNHNSLSPKTPNPLSLIQYDEDTDTILSQPTPPSYNYKKILLSNGYEYCSKIASTLQGEVFKAKCITKNSKYFNKDLVIKIASRELHNNGIAIVENQKISIEENIVKEIRILKWLSTHHPPPYMTRYVDCFIDNKNIFLIMEDGGMDFFKFVSQCHKLIDNNSLKIIEWQSAVRALFKQIIIFMDWLHNKMNICHLDISLENLLISNVFIMTDYSKTTNQKRIYFSHNFQIKFCDFGLSEAFAQNNYRCDKYVGKTGYKAPKVYGKKEIFDARAADVWSLGVCLFMMIIGAPPFKKPSCKETGFNLIYDGKMYELLEAWGRMDYITPKMYDLLVRMLTKESKRITVKQIKLHPWLL